MGGSLFRGPRPEDAVAMLPAVSFDHFLGLLGQSTVTSVIFRPDDVLEVVTGAARMTTRIIRGLSTEWVVQRLVETRTPFLEGRKQLSSASKSIRGGLVLLLPIIYLWLAYQMMKKLTEDSQSSLVDQKKKRRARTGAAPVTWDDVAGIDSARRELQEVVDFLCKPERFLRMGARCPRGVLLSGPPGCGKTLLARAAAHEAGCNIIVCSASDFVEVFVGRGAARVRDLFQRAERCAPCILFFDELDALAKSRSAGGFGNDEREQTLNQLLTEMDGFDSRGWGEGGELPDGSPAAPGATRGGAVVVIAATNRPDVLDSALVRPGRFDRHVRVPLPDEDGRLAILRVHVQHRSVPLQKGADLQEAARASEGFSGAELGNIVNEACLLALRADREAVSPEDLRAAVVKCWQARGVDANFSSPMSSPQ
mmetsp:Transcript_9261/g.23835  ORF Transcript_9261/g.23835 Transcript_9261/m.23835 type:complete len:424 (+) Transcript_9261:75-1346(+)